VVAQSGLVLEGTNRAEEAHRAPWLVSLQQNLGEAEDSVSEVVDFAEPMGHAQAFLDQLSATAQVTASGGDLAEVRDEPGGYPFVTNAPDDREAVLGQLLGGRLVPLGPSLAGQVLQHRSLGMLAPGLAGEGEGLLQQWFG
jgi:hypothetical protein